MSGPWTRREWLAIHTTHTAVLAMRATPFSVIRRLQRRYGSTNAHGAVVAHNAQTHCLEPGPLELLVQHAVDTARSVGAQYADARFTRVVRQDWNMTGTLETTEFSEKIGVGVRVLVNGYWGFAASALRTTDAVVRLAREAVAQATENAKGPSRAVDMGVPTAVSGRWMTPIRIDPFIQVPLEEKLDFINYWRDCAEQAGVAFDEYGLTSPVSFVRQERVVATSEGSLITQTLYESGGVFVCKWGGNGFGTGEDVFINDIDYAGKGWEVFFDAKLLEQFPLRRDEALERAKAGRKPTTVGRYTLVCDGATMASVLDRTLGVATQLDRALGYEANAGGTSFIDDPLAMVGMLQIAAPGVTVTANRSAPTQLATVRWDDEGVVPTDTTLVKNGVLVDFQTTREQATWLTPYYAKQGRSARSNGCAAAESAHFIPMQHMPNLALAPNAASVHLTDLIADVAEGLFMEGGRAVQMDAQARTGILTGRMRQIKNGRLGANLQGGAVLLETKDFWKHLSTVGGSATRGLVATALRPGKGSVEDQKGQPEQWVPSHTITAAAAAIPNQPLIYLGRKA